MAVNHRSKRVTFWFCPRPQVISRWKQDQTKEREKEIVESSSFFIVLKLHSSHFGKIFTSSDAAYEKRCDLAKRVDRNIGVEKSTEMSQELAFEKSASFAKMVKRKQRASIASFDGGSIPD